MANSPKIPSNQTGAALSPENIKKMLDACEQFPPDIRGNEHVLEKQRVISVAEANTIGSMPPSATLKGIVKKSLNALMGNHPELFLDKLGERLAYERTGIRLYEAAIAKAMGLNEPKKILQNLLHIKNEEAEHMELIKETIEELGADPTAMTPCADLVGVMGQGFVQVLTDPRTDMAQAFNTLLNVELIDNAAWELLIDMANNLGHSDLSSRFETALAQEDEHLRIIKSLFQYYLDLDDSDPREKMENPKENPYHVEANKNGGWDVRREQSSRVSRHFSKKADAIAAAREMSKNAGVEVYIHSADKTKH